MFAESNEGDLLQVILKSNHGISLAGVEASRGLANDILVYGVFCCCLLLEQIKVKVFSPKATKSQEISQSWINQVN